MVAYEKSTRPLIDYYVRNGKLVNLPASGTPAEILERSLHALNEQFAATRASDSRRS
jgi:adenylate kinase family enzyme